MSEPELATIIPGKWGDRLFLDEDEFPWAILDFVTWGMTADGVKYVELKIPVSEVSMRFDG